MNIETNKKDGDIKMEILCRQLKTFQIQKDQAHKGEIGARINQEVLEIGINKINSKISELMKSGVKRFVVPDKEIETPAQQPNNPEVR